MTLLGNIFLAIAAVISCLIIGVVFGKEPTRAGDGAGGYVIGVLIFCLVLFINLIFAAICTSWKGGFDWISPRKSIRFSVVAICLCSTIVTIALSALFKFEKAGVPPFFNYFSQFVPAIFPIVVILSGFMMLNGALRSSVPVAVYQIPLMLISGISILGLCSGIYAWVSSEIERGKQRVETKISDNERHNRDHLTYIDACDVTKDMANILVYTDFNHDSLVREKALAKIKSSPDWQGELIRLLENRGALEAFYFLASNDPIDKTRFNKPILTGIFSMAEWVKKTILQASHESHLYREQFTYEIERVLRTVDKYEGMGTDYRPAIQTLMVALDTPSEVKKVSFNAVTMLRAWMKKHS